MHECVRDDAPRIVAHASACRLYTRVETSHQPLTTSYSPLPTSHSGYITALSDVHCFPCDSATAA